MAAKGSEAAAEEQDRASAPASDSAEVIQSLDLSQPIKFTPDLRRRISGAMGHLCEALSAALTAGLRTDVTLEPGELGQHTWAAAKARLAPDALAVAIGEGPPERAMLLAIELPMALQALECMLGGKASLAPSERHLTEIDWALAKGMIDTVAAELSATWEELGGGELRAGHLDMEGDAGVAVAPTEPTLTVSLASRIDGCDSGLSLLLPFRAVAAIADGGPSHAVDAGIDRHDSQARALSSGLAGAQVLLRAEIGSLQMPIEQMLAIAPQAVVELDERARDGVLLYAEEVSIGRGQPGASGTRKALKLETVREEAAKADTYATLGRAELERARAHALATPEDAPGSAILRSIFVRVWAELGRTHMALGNTLTLTPGAVVELDQAAGAPVELFANGLCFASGTLVVTAEGGWGVSVANIM
jgi:flagellar motor switch protein FliM